MEIKDYLYLYLGCKCEHDCWLDSGDDMPGNKKGRKIGLLDLHILSALNFFKPKPILRSLSSMTEVDCLKICSIVSPTIFGDYRYRKWKVSIERDWDDTQKNYTVRRDGDDHSFEVDCLDGDVLLYCDDKDIDAPYMNFNYKFDLVKMGFDVFGLIKAGLAIDATKVKS